MNKYTALGLALAAAAERRSLLVVVPSHVGLRAALDELRAVLPSQEVRLAKGAERITYPGGGRIYFTTPRSRAHIGLSVDTVFLDADVDRDYPDVIGDLEPCIQTSPTGELVRA